MIATEQDPALKARADKFTAELFRQMREEIGDEDDREAARKLRHMPGQPPTSVEHMLKMKFGLATPVFSKLDKFWRDNL